MAEIKIISNEELYKMFDEEERTGRDFLEIERQQEIDGKWCQVYKDTRNGKFYASQRRKSVHMGFNSNEEGKVEELIATVEKYGEAEASYGVNGRTCHEMLAHQLSKLLPQFRFVIGYNYQCEVYQN